MTEQRATLVLRLAGPLQSWGTASRHNRRATGPEPSKSGLVGLLAAAQGRRRSDPVDDLAALDLGVRVDQPGQLRRDYHTVSRLGGQPLPSTAVTAKGVQKSTAPAKYTHVTQRFYLEEAVFVAAVSGPATLMRGLTDAVMRPAFPLALGRRACVPTQPLLISADDEQGLFDGAVLPTLESVPWQVSRATRRRFERSRKLPASIELPVVMDDPLGDDLREDMPISFDPRSRRYGTRRVSQRWVSVPTGAERPAKEAAHDPFALLGW